jgi:hypothetical protein
MREPEEAEMRPVYHRHYLNRIADFLNERGKGYLWAIYCSFLYGYPIYDLGLYLDLDDPSPETVEVVNMIDVIAHQRREPTEREFERFDELSLVIIKAEPNFDGTNVVYLSSCRRADEPRAA